MNKNDNKTLYLNFENEENTLSSLKLIRSEYFDKAIKTVVPLLIIIEILIISSILLKVPSEASMGRVASQSSPPPDFPKLNPLYLSFHWILFCIGVYFSIYLITLLIQKFTPSMLKHLKREIESLEFQIRKNNSSLRLFIVLNSISLIILLFINFRIILITNPFLSNLIKSVVIVYLVSSLVLSILWRIFFDHFRVELTRKYFISLHPYFKLRKGKNKEISLIGIYLTSSRIGIRIKKVNKELYKKISEERWLPRKRRFAAFSFYLNPYLYFHEFSTPVNFQKQFLNIALALQDWDLELKK